MTFSVGGRCWDFDCLRDRLWLWWEQRRNNPGRHSRRAFDREMDALAATIESRPWPAPTPAADPEWADEARLRTVAPRYYAPDAQYWRDAWAQFGRDFGSWRADSARLRRECGLAA